MDRKDETMNLDAIKEMLDGASVSEDLDLDSILAEFDGTGTKSSATLGTTSVWETGRAHGPDILGQRPPAPAQKQPEPRPQQTTYTPQPEQIEDEEEYDAAPRRKRSRKEAKAAKRAAELAEEEEEIHVRDPSQAARVLKRQARLLSFRSILVLILALAASYISLAPQFDFMPLPPVLDITMNPTVGIGTLIGLQFAAIFLGIDIFGMGFSSMLHGVPDRTTLVSFSILAGLLYAASIIVFDNENGVEIPYIAVSILMLYASMRDERGRLHAQARSYAAISSISHSPMAVYSHFDRDDNIFRAVKGPLHSEHAFLLEMERMDSVDRFSMIYVPIALAASLICSLVASVGQGEPMRVFWAFSAIMSVCAPIGLLCAFGASYKNVARKLLSQGAALAGARQAQLLRGTEEVVLSETDLFPPGSVSLDSMQNLSSIADGKVLACAAALTEAAGLELGRVLSEITREQYGVTLSARNVQRVEGGITGRIGTSNVVIGSAELMLKMGIRPQAPQDEGGSLYLVIDNALSGIFALRYQPTKFTYQAMRLMRRMHMNAMIAARDFNISPAMVEQEFGLNRGFADQQDLAGSERLLDPAYTEGDAPAAILTRSGAGAFMSVLRCADKLAGSVRSALTLSAVAGLCGMGIVFYLVFHNAVEALPVLNLLAYQLAWYIPVFLIVLQTN